MATVTPNFNWPVPTSTDLVKDGATAIEALGDSIDASLVDLKGGTTGQVLAKATNTNMDFVWVAQDDSNAIQNSIVDAKGDLIAATANDTPARLAVGANGETLVADSSTSTGLRYQGNFAAGKQMLLNSNFDIWQRGTSFASTGYMCDRWQDGNSSSNITASRQTTGAPVGSTYYLRYTSTGGTSYKNLMQLFETSQSTWAWGQTLTFSIKLRRNATLSGGNINVMIDKSVTTDASAGATWVNISTTSVAVSSLSTGTTSADWVTATVSAAIPSDGTANSIRVQCAYSAAQASGSILEFAQPQLEVGALRTGFQTATGTIQGELACAQRYYQKSYPAATVPGASFPGGYSLTIVENNIPSTNYYHYQPLIVQMRTDPSVTIYSGSGATARVSTAGGSDLAANSAVAALIADNHFSIQNSSGAALTAGSGGFLFFYVASAEL